MPNMSRKSLDHHHERVNLMVARNPEQEEFIRRRYEQIDYARLRNNREQNNLTYDSTDELDVVESEIRKRYNRNNNHYMYNRYESQSWITRFVSKVVTIFYNFVGIFIGSKDDEYLYSNRVPEQKGESAALHLCFLIHFSSQVSYQESSRQSQVSLSTSSVVCTWGFHQSCIMTLTC